MNSFLHPNWGQRTLKSNGQRRIMVRQSGALWSSPGRTGSWLRRPRLPTNSLLAARNPISTSIEPEAVRQAVGFLVGGLSLVPSDLKRGSIVTPFPISQHLLARHALGPKLRQDAGTPKSPKACRMASQRPRTKPGRRSVTWRPRSAADRAPGYAEAGLLSCVAGSVCTRAPCPSAQSPQEKCF